MKLKINEVFNSIQGEGRYQGCPVTFIKLASRNNKCNTEINTDINLKSFAKGLNPVGNTIVFMGDEPLLQLEAIRELKYELPSGIMFHLETSGELMTDWDWVAQNIDGTFDYVCITPEDKETAKRVYNILERGGWTFNWDIKVITDLIGIGKKMLKYSTVVMSLITHKEIDKIVRKSVWNYCVTANKFYSACLHVEVFGTKKGAQDG